MLAGSQPGNTTQEGIMPTKKPRNVTAVEVTIEDVEVLTRVLLEAGIITKDEAEWVRRGDMNEPMPEGIRKAHDTTTVIDSDGTLLFGSDENLDPDCPLCRDLIAKRAARMTGGDL